MDFTTKGAFPEAQVRMFSILVLLALASFGCGGSGDAQQGGAQGGEAEGGGEVELSNVKLTALPVTDIAPLQVAIDKGYFEEEGLNVAVRYVQNGSVGVSSLLSGDTDISFGNYISLFQARNEDLPLTIVAEATRAQPDYSGVYVLPDSDIEEPADLEGKTVAVANLNSIGPNAIDAQMAEAGADYEKVEFVEVPFPNMGQTLETGDVDAVWVVEPFTTQVESTLKARRVFDCFAGPTDGFPIAGYQVTEQFAAENPNTVAAFKRALAKGAEEGAGDDQVVRDILPTYTQVSPEVAEKIALPEFVSETDASQLQRVADAAVEYGQLEEEVDVASFTQEQ
jgi:NitT/TauT family transport system substrate-binding protein